MNNYIQKNVNPTISVLLPVYNEKLEYLSACLQSIKSQTFEDWECILVIDSDDKANLDFLKKWCVSDNRFRYEKTPQRLGLARSLNHGVEISKADIIARMDSDDLMLPQRLEVQLNYLNENQDVSVVGSNYDLIDHSYLQVENITLEA